MSVEAIDPFPRVDVYDAALAGLQEIEVDLRREVHPKINRAERSVAAEQVERETQVLREQSLLAATEKVATVRTLGSQRRWAVGRRRPSTAVSLVPVKLKNQRCPKMG